MDLLQEAARWFCLIGPVAGGSMVVLFGLACCRRQHGGFVWLGLLHEAAWWFCLDVLLQEVTAWFGMSVLHRATYLDFCLELLQEATDGQATGLVA